MNKNKINLCNHEFVRKKQNGGRKLSDTDWFYFSFYNPSCFFMIRVDPSPVLFYFYFFIRSELVRVDPTWTGSPSWSGPTFVLPRCISHFLPYPPPGGGGGTASSFSSQMTNSWGQGCLNSQAPAKEIKIGGQMDGAVGIDLCIRKSSSLSICFFGWDALNNLITHIQVRHSIKIFSQF